MYLLHLQFYLSIRKEIAFCAITVIYVIYQILDLSVIEVQAFFFFPSRGPYRYKRQFHITDSLSAAVQQDPQ